MIDSPTRDRSASAARKTSAAWAPFRQALERVLANLGEDRVLILRAKRSGRCIQFAGQGAHGMRAEVIGNAFLSDTDRLGPAQLARLDAHGWRAPTGTPEEATPELDPDGSPNPYLQLPAPVDAAALADTAVHTIVEVLEVTHPWWLEYHAFDAEAGPFEVPELGLKPSARAKDASGRIARTPTSEDILLAVLREVTGLDTLGYDEDRDVGLRFGDQPVLVRLVDDPPRIRMHSVVLDDVEPDTELLARLNELNMQPGGTRWFTDGRRVMGVIEIPAVPVVPMHVAQALHALCRCCERVIGSLAAEAVEGSDRAARGDCRTLH